MIKNMTKTALTLLLMVALFQVQAQKTNKGLMKQVLASKTKWEALKKEYKNCYTYVTSATSVLGGFTVRTYITVKRGKITKAHRVTQYKKRVVGERRKKLSREERKKLKNLDEIYAFATEELTKKSPKNNYIAFKVAENGIISKAGYTPRNCMDDCFKGFAIDEVKRLK